MIPEQIFLYFISPQLQCSVVEGAEQNQSNITKKVSPIHFEFPPKKGKIDKSQLRKTGERFVRKLFGRD